MPYHYLQNKNYQGLLKNDYLRHNVALYVTL